MRWSWGRLSQVERVDLYTRQSLYVFTWVSVAFVLLSAGPDADADDYPAAFFVAVAAGLVLAGAGTIAMRDVFALYPRPGPLPWRSLGPFVVLGLATFGFGLTQPEDLRVPVCMMVLLVASWTLGGLTDTRTVAVVVLAIAAIPTIGMREPLFLPVGVLMVAFLVATVRISLWLLRVVTELDQAKSAQSALAVAEERLRFSRDVHDVLGRRLSTIAVQSELAATLAERGDERAGERMLEVRAIAHEALREARELARGYRAIDLDHELEGARSLLRSAGIEVRLAVDGVPGAWQEAAGWVVREAVTNVLRHSSATLVTIEWVAADLVVTNDGAAAPGAEGGTGLAGLRERLAPLGASLTTTRRGTSFVLVASLPGDGPVEEGR
jgi:two-component system sensor histidine kinase DesK